MKKAIEVEKYKPKDRTRVEKICGDAAFLGRPIEGLIPHRRFIVTCLLAYYLNFERDNFFVARENPGGEVVGYICGASSPFKAYLLFPLFMLPLVTMTFFREFAFLNCRVWVFIGKALWAFIRREIHRPGRQIMAQFPAHLHINVDDSARGKGVGRLLVKAYLDNLHRHGTKGVHVRTSGVDRGNSWGGYRFFKQVGFREAARNRTNIYSHVLNEPVYLVTMVKEVK